MHDITCSLVGKKHGDCKEDKKRQEFHLKSYPFFPVTILVVVVRLTDLQE